MGFVLVLIVLFSVVVTAEALRANIGSESAISLQWGPVDRNFQIEGVATHQPFFSQKTRLNDLSYGLKIRTDFSSFLSQCTHLTDGRTDGRTDGQSELHSMQRGKKVRTGQPNKAQW